MYAQVWNCPVVNGSKVNSLLVDVAARKTCELSEGHELRHNLRICLAAHMRRSVPRINLQQVKYHSERVYDARGRYRKCGGSGR